MRLCSYAAKKHAFINIDNYVCFRKYLDSNSNGMWHNFLNLPSVCSLLLFPRTSDSLEVTLAWRTVRYKCSMCNTCIELEETLMVCTWWWQAMNRYANLKSNLCDLYSCYNLIKFAIEISVLGFVSSTNDIMKTLNVNKFPKSVLNNLTRVAIEHSRLIFNNRNQTDDQ